MGPTAGLRARPHLAVLLAGLLLGAPVLGACGKDDGGSASGSSSPMPRTCPFDAERLSEATGLDMASAAEPEGSPPELACVFVEGGQDLDDLTAFTIAAVEDNSSASLSDRHDDAATRQGFRELPDLGEDAFLRQQTIPSGADDTDLEEAVITYEVDGQVQTVVLSGVVTPAELTAATNGVVELLSS